MSEFFFIAQSICTDSDHDRFDWHTTAQAGHGQLTSPLSYPLRYNMVLRMPIERTGLQGAKGPVNIDATQSKYLFFLKLCHTMYERFRSNQDLFLTFLII